MSIHIKKEHAGLLHRDLGVKPGKHLTEKQIRKAEHSRDPAERKRAVFAENSRHWHHGK